MMKMIFMRMINAFFGSFIFFEFLNRTEKLYFNGNNSVKHGIFKSVSEA